MKPMRTVSSRKNTGTQQVGHNEYLDKRQTEIQAILRSKLLSLHHASQATHAAQESNDIALYGDSDFLVQGIFNERKQEKRAVGHRAVNLLRTVETGGCHA